MQLVTTDRHYLCGQIAPWRERNVRMTNLWLCSAFREKPQAQLPVSQVWLVPNNVQAHRMRSIGMPSRRLLAKCAALMQTLQPQPPDHRPLHQPDEGWPVDHLSKTRWVQIASTDRATAQNPPARASEVATSVALGRRRERMRLPHSARLGRLPNVPLDRGE